MARNTPITPKRGRNAVPSRVIIGRLSKGIGAEEILDLDSVAREMVRGNNPVAAAAAKEHSFLGFFAEGRFSANQQFPLPPCPIKTNYPSGDDKSEGVCKIPGAVDRKFYLTDDPASFLVSGTHKLVTVAFAAGALIATFTYHSIFTVDHLARFTIVADTVVDDPLALVHISFCGDQV